MKALYTILLIASSFGFIIAAGADKRKHKIALFIITLLSLSLFTVLRGNSPW